MYLHAGGSVKCRYKCGGDCGHCNHTGDMLHFYIILIQDYHLGMKDGVVWQGALSVPIFQSYNRALFCI